jgi:hypothetical protein
MPDDPTVVPNIPALPIIALAAPDTYSAPTPKTVEAAVKRPPMAAVLRYVPATYPAGEVIIMPPAA